LTEIKFYGRNKEIKICEGCKKMLRKQSQEMNYYFNFYYYFYFIGDVYALVS